MTKSDLATMMANATSTTKASSYKTLNTILNILTSEIVAGEKISIRDFASFSTFLRKKKKGRNLRTGEIIVIPECNIIRFTPSSRLKKSIQCTCKVNKK